MLNSKLETSEKLTLFALLDHLPDCRPGLERLATMTSLSARRVGDQLNELEDVGIIQRESRSGTSTRYHLNDNWLERLVAATPKSDRERHRQQKKNPGRNVRGKTQDVTSTPPGRSVLPPRTLRPKTQDVTSTEVCKEVWKGSLEEKKLRSAPQKPPAPASDSKQLWEVYFQAYERVREQKPVFNNSEASRAGKAFNDLLKKAQGLDPAKRVITTAFADEWTAANRCQPWEILADYNKHAGKKPQPRKGQPDYPDAGVGARMLQPREA